jgi:hypothetical protein
VLERLRRTLVESLIGAIALGVLLAVDILRFVNVFVSPVEAWVRRSELPEFMGHTQASVGFPFRVALPEVGSFLLLLIVWYLLFRWLYFKPFETGDQVTLPNQR